ncbi:MAG: undecaprenyldiphospho-muramoylpentapeptide beta-N-acetylglucosaminyltransferase [Candidatus Omnitrophota bacterium]
MKIIMATGASGGHIFPALSVARELKKEHHLVEFIGALKDWEEKIKEEGFDVKTIKAQGLHFSSAIRSIKSMIYMGIAIVKSYQYLKKHRPDVVVGFGGYGAFAPMMGAVALRLPTLIHEQNVIPGRANRCLSVFADKIAVSFQESTKYFDKEKTLHTGCPVHVQRSLKSKQEILRRFQLREGLPTVMVLGGSQGCAILNETFIQGISALKTPCNFQVIHSAGKLDFDKIKERYKQLNLVYYLTDFLDNVQEAYEIADCVISRAGAATITEIADFEIPAVIIPYPFAQGHQKENAKVLKQAGLAKVIEEKDLSEKILMEEVMHWLGNRPQAISQKIRQLFLPEAAKNVAKVIRELA